MKVPADELTKLIFNKPLQQCSVDELQQFVQQYPYFGLAHFLLTKKLKQENAPEFEDQLQSTSLYFQNRLWLHHLLNDDGTESVVIEKNSDSFDEMIPGAAPETSSTPGINLPEESQEQAVASPESTQPTVIIEEQPTASVMDPVPVKKEESKSVIDMSSINNDVTEKSILFEPYHTVDYFASQGIKYKEEERPKDRFSAQLKSFTEWLKTMKRVAPGELIATPDPGTETQVEKMAEHSLAERHVVTEAMAEVWKKQGNKAKAEDIYNKLSLLDPSKSSYFAAKIEELKKTS